MIQKSASQQSYWYVHQSLGVSGNFPWLLLKSAIGTHSLHVIRSSLFPSWNSIATIIACWKHHAFCVQSSDWVTEATGSNPWRTMCEKCIAFLPLSWKACCGCKSSTDDRLRDIICSWSCWSAEWCGQEHVLSSHMKAPWWFRSEACKPHRGGALFLRKCLH